MTLHDTMAFVAGAHAMPGERGELRMARTERAALRLWEGEPAGERSPEHTDDYDVLGYVISGRLAVTVADDGPHELHPGDSWAVPAGTPWSFEVLATAKVLEAVVGDDARPERLVP